ncbi:MAG: tyrosine-protein phosphatase [Planctomycetota bacterium]
MPFSPANFTRNAAIVAAAITTAALAGRYAYSGLFPNLIPKNFGTVVEGSLYRSGELTPTATRLVAERHDIKTIIDLGAHEPGSSEEHRAQATADALGLTRIVFDLEGDATGDPNSYVDTLRLVQDPANQPVLVHCAAGAQRTGCFVMLYRHLIEGVPANDAMSEATNYRHDPSDTPEVPAMFLEYKDAVRARLNDPSLPPIPYDGEAAQRAKLGTGD